MMKLWMSAAMGAMLLLCGVSQASAFCGFYVSGATGELYNEATMVVMMREGTKTVLSMRNDYKGPPEKFALVIPVPQVLREEQVKTLSPDVFKHVDALSAPRLVEYWEQDPCYKPPRSRPSSKARRSGRVSSDSVEYPYAKGTVKVEAQFEVGEYEVVVLSATESSGLETWLLQNKYTIPPGAKEVLAPYIAAGQYFFVAKVNPQKVAFSREGKALLSPLRFDYDSSSFSLPVRLGLLNAKGPQDLLVHILAKGQRYEVANMKNTTIPTNLVVKSSTRAHFAQFYTSLVDATLEAHPGAVLTEYSWSASSCDPCPTPGLSPTELSSLGADLLGEPEQQNKWGNQGWTLTRLHARYTKEQMTQDLVFSQAKPLLGGRGMPEGRRGVMSERTKTSADSGYDNTFQGRYIILNPWKKKIACTSPNRGRWGGPTQEVAEGRRVISSQQQAAIAQGAASTVRLDRDIVRGAPGFLKKASTKTKKKK